MSDDIVDRPFDTGALLYFEAAARHGSLTAAAQKLRLAPSALSRKIRQLETEVGTSLFDRLPHGLQLTAAGEIMLHHARQGFQEFRRAREIIDDVRKLRRGKVSIATVETTARGLLLPTLTEVWQEYPDIGAEVQVVASSEVIKLLRQGECELGLAFFDGREMPGLELLARAELPIGAVVPRHHRWATRSSLDLAELAEERVLMGDATMLLYTILKGGGAGSQRAARLSSNSTTLLSDFASAGAGIVLKTQLGLEPDILAGRIAFVPLADSQLPKQRLALWKGGPHDLSKSAALLASALIQRIQALAPE